MQRYENGDITLKRDEVRSLQKVLHACSWAIGGLSSGGDLIGWENDYALGMWEDKLNGETHELSYYIGDSEGEEDEEEDREKVKKPTTVGEWLFDYGVGYQ